MQAIITTSWDDGYPSDLKLAELLKKYDIPATFYIPIGNVERVCMDAQQIREIARDFDIGGHGYHHVNLTTVPPEEAEREIMEGKSKLEQIIGREVLSFCYPCGSFNNEIISIVRGAGFIGARTVRLLSRSIKDAFRMDTTICATDTRFGYYAKSSIASRDPRLSYLMLRNKLFRKGWEQAALNTLDSVVKNGGVWHLWGHTWEIDENGDWAGLEKVLHGISLLSKWAFKMDNSQLIKVWTGRK